MENQISTKNTEQLITELRERPIFDGLLAKARGIKEKHQIETFIYFEIIDLLREGYLNGYLEGGEMSQAIYNVGKYSK